MNRDAVTVLKLLSLVLLVVVLYFPGSSGVFLLDDYGTLGGLSNFGPINSLEKLWLYVSSGNAGPTGRPIPLLTFAANAQSWPADPFPFLLTNIIIHAFNGILVYFLTLKLLSNSALKMEKGGVSNFALIVAVTWVLLPFHVSTTLYVVQRMTLLAATFSLASMILYLNCRRYLILGNGRPFSALGGCLCCIGMAIFSKENALLIPVYVLIIECFIRASAPRADLKTLGESKLYIPAALFFVCSASVVTVYPIYVLAKFIWIYFDTGQLAEQGRDFNWLDRIIIQQKILGEYIFSIIIPKLQSGGVFYDGYPVANSTVSYITCGLWLVFHCIIIAVTAHLRLRAPLLFWGALWFYASHMLESSIIMLELKYDHRNYLASLGIVVIVISVINQIKATRLRQSVLLLSAGILSFMLYMNTSLWGSPLQASLVWTKESPYSVRALHHAANLHIEMLGKTEESKALAKQAAQIKNTPTPRLKYILAFCEPIEGEVVQWKSIGKELKYESINWTLHKLLKRLLNQKVQGECDRLTLEGFLLLTEGYRENPNYENKYSTLSMTELEITAALHFGDENLAVEFDQREQFLPIPLAYKMNKALAFANFGCLNYAVSILEAGVSLGESKINTNDFTLRSAHEMLELMKSDIKNGENKCEI